MMVMIMIDDDNVDNNNGHDNISENNKDIDHNDQW